MAVWRYKKWYYGPRADRLRNAGELAQMLLEFAEVLDRKPISPHDVPPHAEAEEERRRVKRRKGRRNLANFENLPVSTHVYELSEAERACPCCGLTRKEIGGDESWQVEYLPGHCQRYPSANCPSGCPISGRAITPRGLTACKSPTRESHNRCGSDSAHGKECFWLLRCRTREWIAARLTGPQATSLPCCRRPCQAHR